MTETATTAAEITPMLIALVPVVAGGLIALAGVIGGGYLTHWLKSRTDNETRKKEKYEELLEIVFAHKHWLGKMKSHRVFASEEPLSESPIAKIRAISSLYFPELKELVIKLDLASDQYELWMLEAGKERLENGLLSEERMAEGNSAYQSYAKMFYDLVDLMETHADGKHR